MVAPYFLFTISLKLKTKLLTPQVPIKATQN